MENRKGQGVFLGVVAVATLIVAIIGATFAYFSASINSNEGSVDLSAYEFSAAIASIEKVAPSADKETGIIPLDSDLLDEAIVGSTGKTPCIDKNDKQVCVIYKATVTNNGSSPVILSTASIKTNENGFVRTVSESSITDLKAAFLGEDDENNVLPTTVSGTAVTLPVDSSADAVVLTGGTLTVPAATTVENSTQAGTAYFYFAVYLEEPVSPVDGDGAIDQSAYMNQSYSGQLFLSTGDGSRITGQFE